MIKIGKYQLFLAAVIVIGIWWFISNSSYRKADNKEEVISYIRNNENSILRFADSLEPVGLADSSFYATFRNRDHDFSFYILQGHDLDHNFRLDPPKYRAFKDLAAAADVENIWKHSDENYYKLIIEGLERLDHKNIFVLVLKSGEVKFSPPVNSEFKIDTTYSNDNFGNSRNTFVVGERIWILLI